MHVITWNIFSWSKQRFVNELYKTLNQVNCVKVPDDLKLPENFKQLVTEMKDKKYDANEFAVILKGMVGLLTTVSMVLTFGNFCNDYS